MKSLYADELDGRGYDIIAHALDQEVIYYKEFGEWQGHWLLVTVDEDNYYIRKGVYGSCEICDLFTNVMGFAADEAPHVLIDLQKARELAYEYPFVTVPKEVMHDLIWEGDRPLQEILPRNIRLGDETIEQVVMDIAFAVRVRQKMDWLAQQEVEPLRYEYTGNGRFIDNFGIHWESFKRLHGKALAERLVLEHEGDIPSHLCGFPFSIPFGPVIPAVSEQEEQE